MKEQELEELTGSVEDIVFHSEDTGFTVLEMSSGDQLITVVGEVLDIAAGEELKVTGKYVSHPTYGVQFKAALIERTVPATANAILKYLSAGSIKGLGPVLARRLVESFGDRTLEVLEKSPADLCRVKGISPKKAQELSTEFSRIFGIRSVMLFLTQYGVEPSAAIRVWKLWGMQAPDIIARNPYLLCTWEIGIPFERADEIAGKLGLAADDPARLSGGIAHILRHNQHNGHCCLPYSKLLRAAMKLLEAEEEALDSTLTLMAQEEELICETVENDIFLYLPNMYEAETYVAGRIMMMKKLENPAPADCTKKIDTLEEKLGIHYAALQREAIAGALTDNLLILTGGPGTGKTTTLNGIITLLEEEGIKVGLAAPTGRAAKRMSELTGREAKTIHRLLEVDFGEERGKVKFRRNAKNPLPYGAVVIDEMSMVDVELFESLLRATRMTCKLILVGDPDQLPSVGAGNVLGDMISSGAIRVVHLTEVFRQAAQSLIVVNAHAIVEGEVPNLAVRDNDFFFLPQRGTDQALDTVVGLVETRLPRTYQFSPLWDIQVLSPSRVGPLGTTELNRVLQAALNPPDPTKVEVKQGGFLFRERDKVMQIRNNYDILWRRDNGEEGVGVYNGDIGVIEMVDRPSRTVLVRYEDRVAEYVFEILGELELAYAVTVHKSQGSEFEAVIIPLMGYHSKLYYRNLLYTGVTRAKRLLILVGQATTVEQMVRNDKKTLRYTNLSRFLGNSMEEVEPCEPVNS